ncbi:nuclear transport factor 2 family protein [Flavitalea antarctica]
MKSALLSGILFMIIVGSYAQNAEDSVKASINQLFNGMKNIDPDLIRNSFADSAVLQTIVRTPDGKVTIRNESVAAFASSISKQAKGALDEQFQFESIKIDGDLASVWTPYKFYFSGKLSHCGVNSFQLVRVKGLWKIQYLIDTRRRTQCE